MSEKRRFSKRAYLSYFGKNASGAYVYTGGHYALPGGEYRAFSLRLGVWTALAAAAAVAQGCIPAPGMRNTVYVLLPYLLEVVCVFSAVWGAVRFFMNKKPLREYVYEATVKALPLRLLFSAIFAAAAMAGETVCLLTKSEAGEPWAAVCFYLLLCGAAVSSLLLRREIRRAAWQKTGPNQDNLG